MKTLLVFPRSFEPNFIPPFGLASLAACLQRAGHTVDILDQTVDSGRQYDWGDYGFVGMTLLCATFHNGIDLARRIRKVNPPVVIAAGGPFPDTCPEEVLRTREIDIVVHGEGEHSIAQLVQAIDQGHEIDGIAGLSFIRDGTFNSTGRACPIEDLDSLPLPAFDLYSLDRYAASRAGKRQAPVMASRGCPYRCVFCTRGPTESRRMRYHSPSRVVELTQLLAREMGCKCIRFVDSTFTVNQPWVNAICDLLLERDVGVEWTCGSRIDCLNPGLLEKMKAAGCSKMCVGIESGNDGILERLEKGFRKSDVHAAAQMCQGINGPELHASFIIGHPWDTRETIRETGEFASELRDTYGIRCGFCVMTPFPGTTLWSHAEEWGLRITKDWERFCKLSFQGAGAKLQANFDTRHLSREELTSLYRSVTRGYGASGRLEPLRAALRKIPALHKAARRVKKLLVN